MNYPLRVRLKLVSMLCGLLISVPDVTAAVPEGESALNRAQIVAEATALIARVRYAALITVDEQGQPRSRVVDAFAPEGDLTIWIATRPTSRKVAQIRSNSSVALYYWDPAEKSYVSIMGRGEVVDDTPTKQRMRREVDSAALYPNFPTDYVLIKVTPTWLEGVLPGFRGDPQTWAPVAVVF
ncbi:MAG: general stress protein 26 [Candidatus Paceibacteria bacterium]|jgi:general stress protein 26